MKSVQAVPEHADFSFIINRNIQGWLLALKDDKRFIVSAAGQAEKAVQVIPG